MLFYFLLFCCMFCRLCSPNRHVSMEVGMCSFCHSCLLFHFLIAPISLCDSLELEAPLCACGLFTRNTDSPSEVWLARTGRGRNMNEFTTPQPSTSALYSQILPSSFFLSTCSSATSSYTFPLVFVCVSESVFV